VTELEARQKVGYSRRERIHELVLFNKPLATLAPETGPFPFPAWGDVNYPPSGFRLASVRVS
jgi:hypothetical protein